MKKIVTSINNHLDLNLRKTAWVITLLKVHFWLWPVITDYGGNHLVRWKAEAKENNTKQ